MFSLVLSVMLKILSPSCFRLTLVFQEDFENMKNMSKTMNNVDPTGLSGVVSSI